MQGAEPRGPGIGLRTRSARGAPLARRLLALSPCDVGATPRQSCPMGAQHGEGYPVTPGASARLFSRCSGQGSPRAALSCSLAWRPRRETGYAMRPGPWAPQPGPCSRRGRCCQQCAPTWGRPPLEPCCSPCRLSVPTKRPSNTLRGRGAGSRGTPGPGLGCTVACGALGSNSSCLLPICSDKLLSGGGAWPGEDPLGRVGPWVPWNERQILRLASTDLQRGCWLRGSPAGESGRLCPRRGRGAGAGVGHTPS